jgi:hypothetical protein
MEAIAQPGIKIQGHAVVADSSNGGLIQRNRMVRKLLKELFGQLGYLRKKRSLASYLIQVRKNSLVEDGHPGDRAAFDSLPIECEAAPTDPLSLVLD